MNNEQVYDKVLTKELISQVDPAIHKYIQSLTKKVSFSTRQINTFLNKAKKLLSQLRQDQKKFTGDHWSLRDWIEKQTGDYQTLYNQITKLLIQGYHMMEMVRKSVTKEDIDYKIGVIYTDTNENLIPEQSGQLILSLDQFLYLFALGRSSGEFPALKAIGSTGKLSAVFSKTLENQSVAYIPFKSQIFQDILARLNSAKISLNQGQIYEAYCVFESKNKNIFSYSDSEFKEICDNAKNSIPGYQGGDLNNTQIKAMVNGSGFSVMKLQTIVAVLTDYIAIEKLILNNSNAEQVKDTIKKYLFTPMKKTELKKQLKQALQEKGQKVATKEINNLLKNFATSGKLNIMFTGDSS